MRFIILLAAMLVVASTSFAAFDDKQFVLCPASEGQCDGNTKDFPHFVSPTLVPFGNNIDMMYTDVENPDELPICQFDWIHYYSSANREYLTSTVVNGDPGTSTVTCTPLAVTDPGELASLAAFGCPECDAVIECIWYDVIGEDIDGYVNPLGHAEIAHFLKILPGAQISGGPNNYNDSFGIGGGGTFLRDALGGCTVDGGFAFMDPVIRSRVVVPEPGSNAMLASGALLLIGLARHRTR